jgi:transcriptional regulator with XRE-family HTH domain
MQHELVMLIRRGLTREGLTVAEYAERTGQSYDRLSKMMRGAAVMRLEDIGAAVNLLPIRILARWLDPLNEQPPERI